MKKYFYYGRDRHGAMLPLFECVAEADPTPVEVNTIYQEIVRQKGLGVPRPTHFASMELHEVPESEEVSDKPLIVHGAARPSDGMVH